MKTGERGAGTQIQKPSESNEREKRGKFSNTKTKNEKVRNNTTILQPKRPGDLEGIGSSKNQHAAGVV